MKLYILVRKDLSRSQQAVQSAHVAVKWAQAHPDWRHEALVLLQVYDLKELLGFRRRLPDHAMFVEPDIGYEATALATTDWLPEFEWLRLL
jgi:hypothetical protein